MSEADANINLERLHKIKSSYPHYHTILKMCYPVEQATRIEDAGEAASKIRYIHRSEEVAYKIDRAHDFLERLHNEFTISPDIDWPCKLSGKIVASKPNIDKTLDCFLKGPHIEDFEIAEDEDTVS